MGTADDPLIVMSGDERVGSLVQSRVGGSVTAAVALWERLQLGVDTAVVIDQFRNDELGEASLMPIEDKGVGGVTLTAKLGVLKQARDNADAALVLSAVVPTGDAGDYLNSEKIGWEPYVAVSYAGTLRLVANVGFRSRKRTEVIDLVVDDEVFARVGIGKRIGRVDLGVGLITSTAAKDPFADAERNAVEALAQLGVDIGPVQAFAGGGLGLQGGFGTPDYRFLGGLRVVIEPRQQAASLAVSEPVKIVATPPIEIPAEPELIPEDIDADDDGLLDIDDLCPKQPETVNGYNDEDGCPDPGDRDKDTITDDVDLCPEEAGEEDSPKMGCPDPDSDDDGLVDRLDVCPAQPGTEDHQGCKKNPNVAITETGIGITGKILFIDGKATLNKKSNATLDDVAAVLVSHPKMKVVISVHTGEKGAAAFNLDLSKRRAETLKWYLVDHGVEEGRIVEVYGKGENEPVNGKAKERVVLTFPPEATP